MVRKKPYAVNPRVRFDEKGSASKEPRRRALLHNKLMCVLVAMAIGTVSYGSAPILLKARTIVPNAKSANRAAATINSAGAQSKALPERGLYIVQHDGIIEPSWRESLEAAGAIIRSYIPENAYLVEASPAVHEAIRTTIPHTYLGEYKGEYRYDASSIASLRGVTKTTSSSPGASLSTKEFSILLFTEECCDEIVAKIGNLAGCSVSGADGKVIRAVLTATAVKEVASWPDVNWVEEYVQQTLDNNVAVESARMNVKTCWPNGASNLGLTGEGQIVGVADSGFDTGAENTMHRDVRGRLVKGIGFARQGIWSDLNGHGTHVVGSVLGDGTESNGEIKGVAYKAKLVMQSLGKDSGGSVYTPNDIRSLYSESYVNGARVHSNSYGGGTDNSYTSHAQGTDDFMFTHPDILILRSAGNDGVDNYPQDGVVDFGSVKDYAVSKNAIVVGAAESYRASGNYSSSNVLWGNLWPDDFPATPICSDHLAKPCIGGIQGMAAFSSRGPCSDDRIKPDIVAPGTGILSLYSAVGKQIQQNNIYYHNQYYRYMQGTSQATPLVAGTAALVREWLQKKRNISNPDGATIKAILLAGAKSLAPGQYGEGKTQEIPKSYPNNVEGWGQVNLGNSLVNSAGLLVYDGKVIEQGKMHTFTVNATAGKALNIVMAYTDAPGNPGSGKALVNNLDLLVKTPGGKLIYPNSKNSADDINNVEGVRIASAESGVYTITVTAKAINQAMATSLTGGKANATRYSLVVNGATEKEPPPTSPANDDIANANTISAQSDSTSGTNVAATKDNEGIGGYASVWWKWTASKSGTATFDTAGSSFDTTLMVYTKNVNGTYKLVKENNDASTSVSYSRVVFETAAGTVYYVAVGGASGKTGSIKMNWSLQIVQKSDLCFAVGSSNSSWPAAVFLSGERGKAEQTRTFKARQDICSYWSAKNIGNVVPKSNAVILHEILKDGTTVVQTWQENLEALPVDQVQFNGNNLDSHFKYLGEGSYVYRITLDNQKTIDELNENNNTATYSFTIQAPPQPAAPTNFKVEEVNASDGSRVQLTWDRVTDDAALYIDGYYVYRNTSATMPSKPWRTVYGNVAIDTTCSANTTYYYWVAAFIDSIVGTPVSGSVRPVNSGKASAFTASATVSGTSIKLKWSGSDGGTHIYIYRSTDGVCPAKEIKKLFLSFSQTPITEWIDESVEPGVKYYYWVMLSNYGDIYSDRLSATVPVQKADLGFYQWSGWPKSVFLSDSSSEATEATSFKSGQNIYLWHGGSNFGYAMVPAGWKVRHQVSDKTTGHVVAEAEETRSALTIVYAEGSAWTYEHVCLGILQNLPAGRYVYRAILDSDNVVDESDESNNEATFDFEVVNESCDLGYCGYTGWLEHLFLSPTNSNAYVPVHRYAVGDSPDVNFGLANWAKTSTLCRKLGWWIYDANDNLVKDAEVEWNRQFTADNWNSPSYGWQWPCALANLAPGTYRLRIVLDSGEEANDTDRSNNADCVVFAVTNTLNTTIAAALEANGRTFTAKGANPPFVQTQVTFDGADAVQFGPAAPNETNTLSTVVTGPGKLSFRWFCACESAQSAEGHRFAFYVDGAMKDRIYGDGRPDGWKWKSYTCDIPAGQHTLSWAYSKDAYADKYFDSAWLDQVSWTPSIKPGSPVAKSISGDESGIHVSFSSSANATSYRVYRAETKSLPNDNYDEVPVSSGTTLEYHDISANPGVEYHYWVSAVGTGGESDAVYCGTAYRKASIGAWSDEVSFDANGGETNVSVWANTEWEVQSKPSWLTATKTTIELGDHSEAVLRISAGGASSAQAGTIKLVAANGTTHPAYVEIHVSQSSQVGPTPSPSTCVVTFGKNGGTGGDNYVTATYGKPMPTPRTAPTLSGWTFAGYWDTLAMDENGSPKGKQYYDASMKSVRNWDKRDNATLWAKWTNKVTLGKNGGTGGDNYVTCTKGQLMPKRTMPTKSGYVFDGYWTTTGAGGVKYYNADGTSAHAWDKSGNVTLWAKWHKPAVVKVTFGKNGGTGGDNYVTCTEGQPMPTPRTAPTLSGWTFAGYWDTLAMDENGSPKGKQYYDASMKSVRNWDKTSATTLWAKWTNKVTLGKNGGTGGDNYVTCTKDQPMPKRTMPTKSGYAFMGYWTTTGAGGVKYYNSDGTSAHAWDKSGSVTLWAKWVKPVACKVTFGKNGGTGGDNYVTATTGKAMPTPRTAPTRAGWTFAGYWDTLATDANGNPTGRQYYDANMKSVRAWDKTSDATLWAKWTVRVKLGKNGGTGGDDYVTVTYNQPFPKRKMPTKSGYKFGGYFVSASSKTGQCYNTDGTGTSSMKWTTGGTPTVWALWTSGKSAKNASAPVDASVSDDWDGGYLQPTPDAATSWPAGLYTGVVSGDAGWFVLQLDDTAPDGSRTAFLVMETEAGTVSVECEAEECGDGIVLTTHEGGCIHLVVDGGGIVAEPQL